MDVHGWVSLASGVAHLALATLVFVRGARTPMRIPLALLSLVCVVWNLASLAFDVSGDRRWYYVDNGVSPLTGVFALHVVIAFVGRLRALRVVLIGAYVFGVATSVFALFSTRFVQGTAVIALALMSLTVSVALLWSHLRRSADPSERRRTKLLLAAITIGCVVGPTEMGIAGVPPLGNLGIFVSMTLVAVGVMRLELLGRELTVGATLYSLAVSLVAVMAAVTTFRRMDAGPALVVIGSVIVGGVLLIATHAVLVAQTAAEQRVTRLATMGRFSTQLAHDLRNPIAAIRGAAQFLEGEPGDKPLADCREFVTLVREQAERLQKVVEDYQRIGRVEPDKHEVDVNDLVRSVTATQALARRDLEVTTSLAVDAPRCSLDEQLVRTALENVLRNAFEATPDGGRINVSTEVPHAAVASVAIVVEDNGPGIDPRQIERVFDDFFTTKTTGSGLGLSFVRRVMQAHGGEASLARGRAGGTVVRMRLPAL